MIGKSFCVCSQVKDVDIDQITCLKEGSSLYDSKSSLRKLMKVNPDEVDYEQLKRRGSVCVDIEGDVREENRNEIVLDDLLDISEGDIGIVQN